MFIFEFPVIIRVSGSVDALHLFRECIETKGLDKIINFCLKVLRFSRSEKFNTHAV